MVKSSNNTPQTEQVFRVVVEPINDLSTTENMMPKLKILFGGIGIKVKELERVEDDEGD